MTAPLSDHLHRLEAEAAASLDAAVVDYVAGGAGEEVSLAAAPTGWQRHRIAPHVLRDVSHVDTSVNLLDHVLPSPVAVAPVGYLRLVHPDGETAVAAGAGDHLVVTSARADVDVATLGATRAGRPWWHQHYGRPAQRRIGDDLADRAVAAGATAIVLTGDTPYVGVKRRQGRLRSLPDGADQAPATLADIGRLAARTGVPGRRRLAGRL